MENMKKNDAFNLVTSSFLMNYYDVSVINYQMNNITILDDEKEFMQLYGHNDDMYLEGFNRNNKMYIGPNGTPHTVIHEFLHNISSSFVDEKRMLNGISSRNSSGFLNWINEGLTDYLAVNISGEPERHYLPGVRFFRGLDKILSSVYGENSILFESYICNNTYFLENFINNYCTCKYHGEVINWKIFVDNFGFFENDFIDELLNNMHKNLLKNVKKSLFNRNPKIINFNKFNELNVVGLIKKSYYDLLYFNKGANDELISMAMRAMIMENDLQYISNKRGVRELIQMSMQSYSLIDVIRNNYDSFTDIPIDSFISGMTR